ncbi:MAG: zinc-dependent metalloprotease [Armatimonadetes bacterium]|nr:zinc-dependent metalloprotease [Armatimonadota bacterium]
MRRFQWAFLWAALWLLLASAAMAQEKTALVYKALKGQKMTYQVEGNLTGEAGGNKLALDSKQTSQEEILDVTASGEIVRQSHIEEEETTVNGNKMPSRADVSKKKQILTIKPDGTIVSIKWEGEEVTDADKKVEARLALSGQVVFSPNPVGVGDKWSREFKEDASLGTVAAAGDYEVLAFEKMKGVDAVKIKVSFRETGGPGRKMTLTGEAWVEKSSGDTVNAVYTIQNMPLGEEAANAPPINGTIKVERTGGSPMGGVPAAEKKEKTIEDVVKEYEKLPGAVTLYRKKEAGKDTLYMEIKEDQLDRLMMLQVTASTGTGGYATAAGNPITDMVFKFVRRGDEQILLVVPNINYRADPKKPIARAVKRSFADAYLESFKIEAKNPKEKRLLFSVGDFFRSDIAQVTQTVSGSGGMYSIDREKTAFSHIKNFPENLVIRTAYNLAKAGGPGMGGMPSGPGMGGRASLADPRSIPMEVTYNLFFLPEKGYRPRLADSRVGYFTTDFQDFSKDKDDQMTRYILRWNLEKSDPTARLSPPKQPIVFWLDNAIPLEYRDAVRKGLLWWNKAFEKAGFKDAVVVKQMPDDADWDHSDMRYNVIRWVASPDAGYAVALFRANPLTGQILNASITVDSNMTRYNLIEYRQMIDPLKAMDPDPLPADPHHCTLAAEAPFQAWMGDAAIHLLASSKATKISEKQYANSFLTSIVAHEMGHIMGLRHNFIASTQHNLKELSQGKVMRQSGVVASVMDYIPFNIMALHSPDSTYWTTGLGVYDYWAIDYGYRPLSAATPEADLPALRRIARRGNEPGHAYQSDEAADQVDPLITRFDLGRDPLAYWKRLFEDVNAMVPKAERRVPAGENYWKLTQTFFGLLNQYARGVGIITRYVGGVNLRRNHKGDPKEKPPVAPVSGYDQRRALALLTRYVFSPKAFDYPKSLYLKLASNPYPDWGEVMTGSARMDAPVQDSLAGLQRLALNRLFSRQTLSRIANNEFKSSAADSPLTLEMLFERVDSAVNAELINGQNVGSLRRLLQRAYVQRMSDMLINPDAGVPDDARMLARYHLRKLKGHIAATRARPHDTYTRIHLEELLDQINKVLDAKYMVG